MSNLKRTGSGIRLRLSPVFSVRAITFLLALFLILSPVFTVSAVTINVPGDQNSIQRGIDAAVDGDTVLVADGYYTGILNKSLNYYGKAIVVRSRNGPSETTINCERMDRGVYFHHSESPDSRFEGFTVRSGYTAGRGGAVSCVWDAAPVISDCILVDNDAGFEGGAVSCYFASPAIRRCLISNNRGIKSAGGIYCFYSSPEISNCGIELNWTGSSMTKYGGGIYAAEESRPVITGCLISRNTAQSACGGGFACYEPVTLYDCCIVQNYARFGGGVYCRRDRVLVTLVNCTISENSAESVGGVYAGKSDLTNCILWDNPPQEITAVAQIRYSDVRGGFAGEGNIDEDPLFIDASIGDFRLSAASPCIDAGHPDSSNVPWGGSRRDMGAYEYDLGWYRDTSGSLVLKPIAAGCRGTPSGNRGPDG